MGFDFTSDAIKFLERVKDTIESALWLPDDVTQNEGNPNVNLNDDTSVVTAEFKYPLCVPSDTNGECVNQPTVSQLYSVVLKLTLKPDSSNQYISVSTSSYQVCVFDNPCIRFEYEKNKSSKPVAHIHLAGVVGALSTALMGNFAHKPGKAYKSQRSGDLSKLHIPLGGHRFRPSIEDFIYFVIEELGFVGKDGWVEKLKKSRDSWHDIQLSAAIRDNPEHAVKTLKDLGYEVSGTSLISSEDCRKPRSW